MNDELDDDEHQLLTIIADQENAVFSLDWLATKSDSSREVIEEKLVSLEKKGYIRLKRIKDAILPQEIPSQYRLMKAVSKTLEIMVQIEELLKKRKQTRREVYNKVRSELLENMEIYVDQIENIISEVKGQLETLDSKIQEIRDKIEEIKLSYEINYVDQKECEKLLDSYNKDLNNLLERRQNISIIFMEDAEIQSRKKALGDTIDSLEFQVEVLNTRRLIGVVDESEYRQGMSQIDEEKLKIERSIEDYESMNIEDVLKKLEKLKRIRAIPKKVYDKVLKQFNMIQLLKVNFNATA